MRIPVSLVALGVALAGCKSSVDSANIDTVSVTSSPTAAAVRLNGSAVGRTPTTIKLDRAKNYELQVGKGGYVTETTELKPRLISTSKGVEYGFPASIEVNLTKELTAGEPGVPPADLKEFEKLSKKALGEEVAAKQAQPSDIDAAKEAAAKVQAALAAKEAETQARLAQLNKGIAETKSAQASDASAKDSAARLARLEQTYAAEIKALKDSQANAEAAIKSLAARADELKRRSDLEAKEAKAAADKSLAEIQKALEEQKAAVAKANEDLAKAKADAVKNSKAAADKAAAKANQEVKLLQAKLAQANKAAEKAVADERLSAEAKLAQANKAAAEAKARAEALKYSEFSSRYALLESKRRSKAISEEDFKAALAGLRKELGF